MNTTQTQQQASSYTFGQIAGRVDLSTQVLEQARKLASKYYDDQEAIEFCGEDVEVADIPSWAPKRGDWLPLEALAALGYKPVETGKFDELVMTLGVDQHIDGIYGPLICLVLHNDGLKFRQGRKSITPTSGDWFLFNDKLNHGVKEAAGKAAFVGIVIPLGTCQGAKR